MVLEHHGRLEILDRDGTVLGLHRLRFHRRVQGLSEDLLWAFKRDRRCISAGIIVLILLVLLALALSKK